MKLKLSVINRHCLTFKFELDLVFYLKSFYAITTEKYVSLRVKNLNLTYEKFTFQAKRRLIALFILQFPSKSRYHIKTFQFFKTTHSCFRFIARISRSNQMFPLPSSMCRNNQQKQENKDTRTSQ